MMAFNWGSFYRPELSPYVQDWIRLVYGGLLLAQQICLAPLIRRYFTSEDCGGYMDRDKKWHGAQKPMAAVFVFSLWVLSALGLVTGRHVPLAAAFNLLFSYLYFIRTRWTSILRGMGAPGYMTFWLASLIFFLELARYAGPLERSFHHAVLFCFQFDFAVMILDSGLIKILFGYARSEGMDYGLVNPYWSYGWRWYKEIKPSSAIFRILNHLAYLSEIIGALALLYPPTRFLGIFLIAGGFLIVAAQIRLGMLAEMVMLSTLIYWSSAGPFSGGTTLRILPVWLSHLFIAFFWTYAVLLPVAKIGLYYNYFAKKKLYAPLQRLLETYANTFGIILWRVFTSDLTDFYVRVYTVDRLSGEKTEYARLGQWSRKTLNRYQWVGEFICLTSIFTTLKYFPRSPERFEKKLLRYAKTLGTSARDLLLFEYISIQKTERNFSHVLVRHFLVDLGDLTVREETLASGFSVQTAHPGSKLHPSLNPGTYVPA